MRDDIWIQLCDIAHITDQQISDIFFNHVSVELNATNGLERFAAVFDNSSISRRILYLAFVNGAYRDDLATLFPRVNFLHKALPTFKKLYTLLSNNKIVPYPHDMKLFQRGGHETTVGSFMFTYYCDKHDVGRILKMDVIPEYFFELDFYTRAVEETISHFRGKFDLSNFRPKNDFQVRILWGLSQKEHPTVDDIKHHLNEWCSTEVKFFGYPLDLDINDEVVYVHCMRILLSRNDLSNLLRLTKMLPMQRDYFNHYVVTSGSVVDEALITEFKKRISNKERYRRQLCLLSKVLE